MELMTERTSRHMELRIDRVSKQYRNKIAVDRLSATLHAGVTGLLGDTVSVNIFLTHGFSFPALRERRGQDDANAHDLRRPHADQRGDHI